jgi:hypothetical protein
MTTEERLEKLEKELTGAKRRSRVMLVATVMAVAVVFLLGAGGEAVQKVVRAERFELMDSTGKLRAVLGLTESGQPALGLWDQDGKARAVLGLRAGPGLADEPGLWLSDHDGKVRAMLDLCCFGQPALSLLDQNGENRVTLALSAVLVKFGEPWLALHDQDGKHRAVLDVTKRYGPGLELFDKNGKPIWSAP